MNIGPSSSIGSSLFNHSSREVEKHTFELVEKVAKNVWIVIRKGDPRRERYLASPSSPFGVRPDGTVDFTKNRQEAEAFNTLLSKHNQAYTIRQILNHENLLSIAGFMEHQPFNKSQTPDTTRENGVQMLVWDFADAGNLSAMFRLYPCESSAFYLPESLCWHVLRSLTRAVTYLHDGRRLFYEPKHAGHGVPGEWVSVNTDWFPILHRCIEPRNVWFQHPRGIETYGQCKLGDFSNVAVTCHAIHAQPKSHGSGTVDDGMALATKEGIWRIEEARHAYDSHQSMIPNEGNRAYTLRDEMWSVGVTIFTMMTGQAPTYCCEECGCAHVVFCEEDGCLEKEAAAKGCDCALGGCEHVSDNNCAEESSRWEDCPAEHHCSESTINIHSYLARARYTKTLRTIVKDLLKYDPAMEQTPWTQMGEFSQIVELAYQEWKRETEEGRVYVDIEDDMLERLVNEKDK